MTDTLRSIVNEMVHSPSSEIVRGDGVVESRICLPSCYRCRLEALLAEYEKVELVKKCREDAKPFLDYHGIGSVILKCADELETWLAVNLERIKAEARMDEAKWWSSPDREHGPRTLYLNEKERIATLEARAKEKP